MSFANKIVDLRRRDIVFQSPTTINVPGDSITKSPGSGARAGSVLGNVLKAGALIAGTLGVGALIPTGLDLLGGGDKSPTVIAPVVTASGSLLQYLEDEGMNRPDADD